MGESERESGYHNAHVVAEKPKCTCRNAGNENVELQTRRAHMGCVLSQWKESHHREVECERGRGIFSVRGKWD